MNDNIIRFGGSFDIEKRVHQIIRTKHGLEWELSQYHLILSRFLKYFDSEQILLIPTELLTHNTQTIVDAVMSHIGGIVFKVNTFSCNENKNSKKYKRLTPDLLQSLKFE